VRIVLLTEDPQAWLWARWLPHLRPLPGTAALLSVGTDPGTWAARAGELRDLVDRRRAAAADPRRMDRRAPAPAVVVVLDGAYRLSQQPGMATVLAEGPAVAVYALCRGEDRAELPRECAGQVLIDPAADGRAAYRERGRQISVTKLDVVNARWADQVARALAPIRDAPADQRAGLPGSIRLTELWGMDRPTAAAVADEWQRRGRTTAVPLGRTAAGTFVLDIARDGPHMLVAGTTGAGKSEFLQTLVASLALGNTPEALVFVLIDFKGGSAFAGCSALPHVVGFLTDLDEHLTQRALVALAAEVRYRERLLLEAGSKDIDEYHAAGQPRGPLPRLVLVVDEFRFLVEQMPDFLQRLTDVTARGRSLGIHLVLATQRPAGVVTEDIRTNMALRVCFRVEDAADSTAVVEFPDAAAIDRQFRGRGYARTERGAVTLFQGGYVGGLPPGSPAAGNVLRAVECPFSALGSPSPGRVPQRDYPADDRTDLAIVVQAIRETRRLPPRHRAWLDPLPPSIPLHHLPAGPREQVRAIPYGVEDRPAEQSQRVIALDLEAGRHLLAGGAPQSGRTTMLRTIAAGIAAGASPGDVHLYVLDCDAGALAPLARLPHCGAVVRRTEKERAARLLDRLAAEIARRQELLAASGFASVAEQRRTAAEADRLPYMVLLLDRWEGFVTDLGPIDNGRLPDLMARLLSEGASAGLRVVATGDKTALVRQTSHFPDRLVLRLADPNDLLMAGVPKGAMPASPPPGRGVIVPGGNEVQVAFAGDDQDGSAQTAALDTLIRAAAGVSWPPGPRPLRVDVIPVSISLAQARTVPGWAGTRGALEPAVAVGGDELSGLGIDLARFPGFAIAGPPLSGRSTALLVVAESLLEAGTAVIVLAPRHSSLRGLAGGSGVTAVFTDASPDPVKLAELLESASGPLAVLVDDAEALHQAPVAEVLAQIPVEGRGRGHALVIAGTSGELLRATRGFTAAARQFRCGLLLTPESAQLGQELFGAKLPRSAAFDRPPGRGYLIQAGQPTLVQVPDPAAG
jgi:DNA segregation ATPase FtsK/SpoIIIE, S-DNA-T family